MAAQSLGYKVAVLDPGESRSGRQRRRSPHSCRLSRSRGLAELAALASAATTEFENVPAAALAFLARTARVSPAAESVAIAQDRIREKAFLAHHGFGVAPYAVLASADDARRVDASLLPGIVKSARFGYDGKGQIRVASRDDVAAAWIAMGEVPCVIEQLVPLAPRSRSSSRAPGKARLRPGPSPRTGIAAGFSTFRSSRRACLPHWRQKRGRSRPPSRRSSTIAGCSARKCS